MIQIQNAADSDDGGGRGVSLGGGRPGDSCGDRGCGSLGI